MTKREKAVLHEIKTILVGVLSFSRLCNEYLDKQLALIKQMEAEESKTSHAPETIIPFRQADYHTQAGSVSFEIPIKRKPKQQ